MKRFYFTILLIGILTLVACSNGDEDAEGEDGKLQVVTTYSILYDIVKNVGGDLVSIHSLAPVGSDPHEYDPLPLDVQKTTDADVIFYNGLNLETGNAWFERLLETTGKDSEDAYVFRLSEGIEPKYLSSEGLEGMEDPHAWLNITYGIKYVENARDALIELDPDNEETYKANAENYISELESLHERAISEFSEIPEEQRILVTSEGAFKYFAEAYGFMDEYIWEINQEEEGTPEQLTRIIDIVNNNDIKSLFVETSVDPRSMEAVSNETGVPIFGEVFTDSISEEGEEGDSYYNMMEWNIETIIEGLE